MNYEIEKFIKTNTDVIFDIHRKLCTIPAPSGHEEKRAEFIKNSLIGMGAEGVFIDAVKNVVLPLGCVGSDKITVIAAHTDTVFPFDVPLEYTEEEGKIYCPGCGDDTAGCAVMLMLAKFLVENSIKPADGLMLVWNSCEEGLGNLKGMRELFKCYSKRIRRFITIDSTLGIVNDRCVGSHRYEVEVTTPGGHSFEDFGSENAIRVLSEIVGKLYNIKIPEKTGTKTTLNIGTISGGTSVNTIAQNAKMLCEYRSDDFECMQIMEKEFKKVFEGANKGEVKVSVKLVGDRPCSDVERAKVQELSDAVIPVIEEMSGVAVTKSSASTDCNIPMSLGIPAVCIGVCSYSGIHTKDEWLEKKSLARGVEILIKVALMLLKH